MQYLSDTPNGAWAEFLRHEEIEDPAELAGVRRAIWSVDLGDPPTAAPALPLTVLTGGIESYDECRIEAAALRSEQTAGLVAPSAALRPDGARGYRVDDGLVDGPNRDGQTIVLFGRRPDLTGWLVASGARPAERLLDRVRPLKT